MNKSTSLLFGSLFLLSACGGTTETATCANDYWNGTVGTCVPAEWTVIDETVMAQRGIEAIDQVVVAFESEKAVSGQFPRVAITEETLAQEMTALEFSEASIRSVVGVAGYEELDTKEVTVAGEGVKLHVFSAQPDEGQPKQRFYQLGTVSGSTGYAVTGMAPLSIDENLEREILILILGLTFTEQVEVVE